MKPVKSPQMLHRITTQPDLSCLRLVLSSKLPFPFVLLLSSTFSFSEGLHVLTCLVPLFLVTLSVWGLFTVDAS